MRLSVIIPTHNPDPGRLGRVLAGLRDQTLDGAEWEAILVDNASSAPLVLANSVRSNLQIRVVREDKLGLSAARLKGFSVAAGDVFVLADDDNVLNPDYLAHAVAAMDADPALGATGGRSLPQFAASPAYWVREFDGLLALRDLGDDPIRAAWTKDGPRYYPLCSPIGAGMVLRRSAAEAYTAALAKHPERLAFDRTGTQLTSGGDNDLVMTVLEAGLAVAYNPNLILTHLIPARRMEVSYLGALNRAISRSWVGVLAIHGIRPWAPTKRSTVKLRCWRAWVRSYAWRGPANWVRWQGVCGTFEGRADLGG